jgi:endoglucanase
MSTKFTYSKLDNIEAMRKVRLFLCAMTALFQILSSCEKDEPNALSVTPGLIELNPEGGTANIVINTDAPSWKITNPASDWVAVSQSSGTSRSDLVTLTVTSLSLVARSAELTIQAGNAKPVTVTVSQAASDHLYSITTDVLALEFKKTTETKTLEITTDAEQWTLTTEADWLQFSSSTGNKGTTSISITASPNYANEERTAVISVNAEHAVPVEITASQKGSLYPNYNTSPLPPDATGMPSTAVQLHANLGMGVNIGNTLEAIGGETAWGNPKITQAFVNALKQNGFKSVRLPVSWDQYANQPTAEIQETWLNRVKEVVQYCINADMYVLINAHWDGGWLDAHINSEDSTSIIAKQKAFWEQIATKMRDFDERVMFAGTNEPPTETAEQMGVLLSYHQTFINAVRSTGGKNTYRVLVVQAPYTDIDRADALMHTLPTDPTPDRMMLEVHYYSPYNFCLMSEDADWGKRFFYWGAGNHSTIEPEHNANWGEEDYVIAEFSKVKTKFSDNGIPLILGEYGAWRRTEPLDMEKHNASVDYWASYVTEQAIAHGIRPFWWDTGGLISRSTNEVKDQRTVDALMQGSQQ